MLSNFPVIHTWQSIVWHKPIQIPKAPTNKDEKYADQVKVNIDMATISVQPKGLGTFVTTQSHVASPQQNNQRLCTMQSTAVVLGISPDIVIPYDAGIPRLSSLKQRSDFFPSKQKEPTPKPLYEWCYQTTESQALLYRLASGDSNHIHVDTSASDMLGSEKKAPILHGLFTLALAYRAIVKAINSEISKSSPDNSGVVDIVFRKIEGKFTQPAFVGDSICVKVWKDSTRNVDLLHEVTKNNNDNNKVTASAYFFVITNQQTQNILVDCGCADVEMKSKITRSNSRL
jgi:acyl dehydratase